MAYSCDNCSNTSIKTVTLLATPQIQFNAIAGVCLDELPFQLTQASVLNGLAGTGVYSGAGVSPTGRFNPQAAGVGLHTIRLLTNHPRKVVALEGFGIEIVEQVPVVERVIAE